MTDTVPIAVQAIAVSALPTCTYNNGTSGGGATLTKSTNGAFPSIDGYTVVLNDRLIINGQSDQTQNGYYTLTTVGSGSTPWVLTRTNGSDEDLEPVPTCVLQGNTYTNTIWCLTAIFENIGTDDVIFVQQALSAPTYNAISGNLPSSITGTSTTASMTVSAGQAANSGNTAYINGAGYSWAVSNGNAINGYQGGATLPNSSTIHMFLCTGGSGTGVFASTSLTPTLPTGYGTFYRRIFSFNTNASGAPIPYTAIEAEGGSILCYLTTQTLDISTTTLGTSARTLYTLNVPTGIKVSPLTRWLSKTDPGIIFTSPDETDVLPTAYGGTTVPLYDASATTVDVTGERYLTTNTSGQIGIRASSATTNAVYGATRGFKDFRRA